MVFQHYALFPHLTVGENVAFGLASQRAARDEAAARVAQALALTDLSGFEGRGVAEISGGQQQRVALARALAPAPRVLLLDEPLSNLDPTLRERTRRELKRAIRRIGITTLFVTHEQEEAFDLGDRVAVLQRGRARAGRHARGALRAARDPLRRHLRRTLERDPRPVARWAPGSRRAPCGRRSRARPCRRAPTPTSWSGRRRWSSRPGRAPDALEGEVVERRYAGRSAFFRVATREAGEVEVLAPPHSAREGDPVLVVPAPGGPAPRVFPRGA